jgi:hypothetical protein
VSVRVIRVQKILFTAIPNEPEIPAILIFREWLKWWANHEDAKAQRHKETFVASSLCALAAKKAQPFSHFRHFEHPLSCHFDRSAPCHFDRREKSFPAMVEDFSVASPSYSLSQAPSLRSGQGSRQDSGQGFLEMTGCRRLIP